MINIIGLTSASADSLYEVGIHFCILHSASASATASPCGFQLHIAYFPASE
jgi:hypothetical protein